jgi:hypothetical protein
MKDRRLLRLAGFVAALFVSGVALADEPPAPGFQEIMRTPDDVARNFAYARAEARAGHLLAAAAALERILLVAPNENGIRLFYVAVLYRLDDLQGAEQQLGALDEAKLTALQKAEADKYRALIGMGRNTFHYSGYAAIGLTADSDALGALHTQIDFFGHPGKEQGQTFLAAGNLDLSQELTPEGDLSVFGTGTIYSRTSIGGPDADYLNGDIHLGLTGYGLKYNWEVAGLVRTYQIIDAPYLTEYGGTAAFNWQQDTSLTWIGAFEGVGQTYHEPFVQQFVPFFIPGTRDGARFNVKAGASYRFNAENSISGLFGYEIKTADYQPFAYNSPFFDGDFHSLLGGGGYFDLSGDIGYIDYRKRDFFFLGGVRREDMRGSLRMAMGAPLSAFTPSKATGDFRENLLVEGAVTYDERTSRMPIAPYSDIGFVMRLIWKFGEHR